MRQEEGSRYLHVVIEENYVSGKLTRAKARRHIGAWHEPLSSGEFSRMLREDEIRYNEFTRAL